MIAPVSLSLRAADYLKLPSRVDNTVKVSLSPSAKAAYTVLERELVLELASDGVITAVNAAVLANKLAQAANGAVYDEARNVHHLHDDKLEALAEILEVATGPVLVAYMFKHDLSRLKARFPTAVALDDPGAIDAWNRGDIPIFLAHPASAGHGLNLQSGGAAVVWFGLNWSYDKTAQFNARLYRQGQTKPVVITYLVSEGTVDEDILTAVGEKHESQEHLLNALRRRVDSALSSRGNP